MRKGDREGADAQARGASGAGESRAGLRCHRAGAAVPALFREQDVIGMIEAGAAIGALAERGIGCLGIADALPGNLAQLVFRNRVADANQHAGEIALLRGICNTSNGKMHPGVKRLVANWPDAASTGHGGFLRFILTPPRLASLVRQS